MSYEPAEREVDEQTVAAARRGDCEAFVRMLKHYDSRLRALAFRVLRDPDLMDDIEDILATLAGEPADRVCS